MKTIKTCRVSDLDPRRLADLFDQGRVLLGDDHTGDRYAGVSVAVRNNRLEYIPDTGPGSRPGRWQPVPPNE